MQVGFRTVLLIIFSAAAVFGLLAFADVVKIGKKKNQEFSYGTVNIWGTIPGGTVGPLITDFNKKNTQMVLRYSYKNPANLEWDLLEAIASGQSPDMLIVDEKNIYPYIDRIYPISYAAYSPSVIKTSFVEAGEIFMSSKGLLAFPLAIDPLIMYYNRSILNTNGVLYPPQVWDDFIELVPQLTVKNEEGQISRSGLAFGQFSNVDHAKDIISALFMQMGSKIIRESGGAYTADLGSSRSPVRAYLAQALSFYLGFSDPQNQVYSWNRSLPNARDFFASESLAFYFGPASEINYLKRKNPNLNFFIAPLPQVKGASYKATFANVIGLTILNSAKNRVGAINAASIMANGDFASSFASAVGLVPARRNLLTVNPEDPYKEILYSTAPYAKSWIDPSNSGSDNIFRRMVEDSLSNRSDPVGSVATAHDRLHVLTFESRQ